MACSGESWEVFRIFPIPLFKELYSNSVSYPPWASWIELELSITTPRRSFIRCTLLSLNLHSSYVLKPLSSTCTMSWQCRIEEDIAINILFMYLQQNDLRILSWSCGRPTVWHVLPFLTAVPQLDWNRRRLSNYCLDSNYSQYSFSWIIFTSSQFVVQSFGASTPRMRSA